MPKNHYTELRDALADLYYTSSPDTDVWVHRDVDVEHSNLASCPCHPIKIEVGRCTTLTEFKREYFRQLGS